MRYLLVCLLLLPAQKKSEQAPPDIIVPSDPTPPAPPAPTPGQPTKLGADQLYIIRSNLDCIVLSSPPGILKVGKDAGPLKIRAKFVDGKDGFETRTYTEKYIWSIETLSKGSCELLIIPVGNPDPAAVVRRMIEALDGPIPPPTPITISLSPTTASVPINGKQQFTATVSQGGVKWSSTGVGSVDQSGLFTAATVPGSASIVAISTLDPTKSATAAVSVTDTPPPSPAPIPDAGFRVLIVYDPAALATMPAAQTAVLYDQTIRTYFSTHCAKVGATSESRIWPSDIDVSGASTLWQTAYKRKRDSLPWILISDGKTGTEQPLPATVADTLALLRKYGGQ